MGWAAGGADGPLQRRGAAQVPAFVAEEAATRDQARTLVLDGRDGRVTYALVRGSGARLGDAETAAAAGADPKLDSVVAGLVAGSGADQAGLLADYAVGYVLVRDSAPAAMGRALDTTPGLTRLSRQDHASLWRVDREVARITVVAGTQGSGKDGGEQSAPAPVAAGPVESRAKLPAGPAGRVLRIADKADPGWQATLDGRPLKRTTVDGWAQGFELPAAGGRLALTYKAPGTHSTWLWAQGLLAAVLVVLALPGRKRQVDDDLPEEESAPAAVAAPASVPAQAAAGEGRRARRLRAAAEAARPDAAPAPEAPPVEPVADSYADPYAASYADAYADPYAQQHVQQQGQEYGQEYGQQYGHEMPYGTYGEQHYQGSQEGAYDATYGGAHQQAPYPYPAEPYANGQTGAYDPYTYGGAHDTTYGGGDRHHRDGSEQQ
ncbi:hypothetical protein [Streptomyces nondiastaticus]